MRCIAIDDEPRALKVMENLCGKVPNLELLDSFRSPVKALDWLSSNSVDLIFLDINMPELTGYDFISLLSQKPQIVLTTAYSDFAVQSYDFQVTDYLLKPVEFKRFMQAVTRVQERMGEPSAKAPMEQLSQSTSMYLKNGSQLLHVRFDELLYIESSGNLLTLFLKDRKLTLRQTMKSLMNDLPASRFLRIHKSFIVALEAVDVFEPHQVIIRNIRLPVGITYRSAYLRFIDNKV